MKQKEECNKNKKELNTQFTQKNERKPRVLLGMSGGVDSSVSAILLQKQGYEVIGCTMKLCTNTKKESSNKAIIDAKNICVKLGITHYIIDFQNEFSSYVINPFIESYQKAVTPNPCIECNQNIKFGCFYEKSKELQCDFFATGHYARIEYSPKYGQNVLKKAKEEKKDQSYFLYRIDKEKIDTIKFPLQDYTEKTEIRQIAKENGLEVAEKKDSQEICFIPENDYQSFLQKQDKFMSKSGNVILKTKGEKEKIIGKHNGLYKYTIGQRKGLGISYAEPLYVIDLDISKNQVIVGKETDLYRDMLEAQRVNWLIPIDVTKPFECYAKIRYRAKEAKAKIYFEKEKIKVIFEEKQRAITPGQSVVFYDEEGIVLGGGEII